jgi:hypothetical protein
LLLFLCVITYHGHDPFSLYLFTLLSAVFPPALLCQSFFDALASIVSVRHGTVLINAGIGMQCDISECVDSNYLT